MSPNGDMNLAGLSSTITHQDINVREIPPTPTQESFEMVTLTPINTTRLPEHNPTKPTAQTFPFVRLPLELRLDITEMTVISPWVINWQGHYHPDHRPAVSKEACKYVCNGINAYLPPKYNIASLLLTSRGVYLEAAPLFYRKNEFHFSSPQSALPIAFQSKFFTTNLRYLAIGTPSIGSVTDNRRTRLTDRSNASRLRKITRLCPNLVSFTNHVPHVLEPPPPPPGSVPPLRQIIFTRQHLWTKCWWVTMFIIVVAVGFMGFTIGACAHSATHNGAIAGPGPTGAIAVPGP